MRWKRIAKTKKKNFYKLRKLSLLHETATRNCASGIIAPLANALLPGPSYGPESHTRNDHERTLKSNVTLVSVLGSTWLKKNHAFHRRADVVHTHGRDSRVHACSRLKTLKRLTSRRFLPPIGSRVYVSTHDRSHGPVSDLVVQNKSHASHVGVSFVFAHVSAATDVLCTVCSRPFDFTSESIEGVLTPWPAK